KYDGEFSKSADQLLELLQFDEKVGTMYDRLHLYSFLSKDLDLADTKYQAMAGRLQDLGSKLSGATSFIRPEMISIGKDKIKQFISENNDLRLYEHYFDDIFRTEEHSLDKDKEEILS